MTPERLRASFEATIERLAHESGLDDVYREIAADAQALADVRTLDEWAVRHPGLAFLTQDFGISATGNHAEDDHSERWACLAPSSLALRFLGPTPDAARHAAAEWVRGQR